MDNIDYDEEDPIEKRFEDLCSELCIEGNIREEAWEKYKDVWTNYAVDGDQIQWLVCSLYECCRKTSSDILGHVVENAYVSLTRLLRTAKMSLVQFFHRIKKWAEMTEMAEDMRDRIDRLESQFAVSSVIFKKYTPVFRTLFCLPTDGESNDAVLEIDSSLSTIGKAGKGSGSKGGTSKAKKQCSSTDLFHFIWALFVKVKANFPAISDDLVNSYHLLLCVMDWIYGNVLMCGRKDLVNADFRGLPRDFSTRDWRPPEILPCVLRAICEECDVNYVECKTIKENFLKPYLTKLFSKEVLHGYEVSLSGIVEPGKFEMNNQGINDVYEEYIMGTGDFDERVFLSPNSSEEIGTSAVQRDSQQVAVLSNDLTPSARRYIQETSNSWAGVSVTGSIKNPITRKSNTSSAIRRIGAGINFTADARGQNLSQLQGLLLGRSKEVSDALQGLLEAHCNPNPLNEIQARLQELCATFTSAYTNDNELYAESANHRLTLAQTLYYTALENILLDEIKKIERRAELTGRRIKPDLTGLMGTEGVHRSLMACCLEVVLVSCDTAHHFPWVLDALGIEAFHFYKMVEIVIKNVDFPREIVKYLNQIVEHILDTYAWKSDSPLWDSIKTYGKAPSIEEVTHPEKIDSEIRGGNNGSSHGVGSVRKLIVDSPQESSTFSPHKMRPTMTVTTSGLAAGRRWMGGGEDESARAAASLLGTSGASLTTSGTGTSEDKSGYIITPRGHIRHDSVALFFRQVYSLSSLRLRDMCDRLNLSKEVLSKVWTAFEHVLVEKTDLMVDRCLDQILICCLYGIAKVSSPRQITFLDIIQVYRMQPQSVRDIYRNVLLAKITNTTTMPVPSRTTRSSPTKKDDIGDFKSSDMLGVIEEQRGDMTQFYNLVFTPRMCDFVKKFTTNLVLTATGSTAFGNTRGLPTLSPLPIRISDNHGNMPTSRRLATNRNIFISPVKAQLHMSPKRVIFNVSNSPGKELREINSMISTAERKILMANMSMGIKRPSDYIGLEVTSAAKRLNFE